ncbi:carbon-nitrogen hydrolase family protein [Virgibacillus sp. C22-A2]|uniref:Carbon-nitrogen hydrolase family protein n=1 Tax=Virgibacillus tibetensis TaxID=3042313 RepID=A0ABU6KDM7_9BACI|nr:carbon-nitrogen hydrolase family protein [Virgibacillus sp. C22-A2]
MKVAVIQLNVGENKSKNLSKAVHFIDEAAGKGADIILLPECVNFFGDTAEIINQAETIPGPTSDVFSKKAKEHKIYINCGSIYEVADSKYAYNTSLLFDTNGEIIAKYRKIHLYDATFKDRFTSKESENIRPGNKLVTADTEFGKFGLSICYDVRFPELFRSLALEGCQMIFLPAAFPQYTGSMYWETLLRARAVENQCYIVAAGQYGKSYNGNVFFGNSLIIDPWGTVIAKAHEGEGITMQDIDLSFVEQVRNNIPTFSHRKPEVYKL